MKMVTNNNNQCRDDDANNKGKVPTNYNYNYKMLFKGTKIKTKIFKTPIS